MIFRDISILDENLQIVEHMDVTVDEGHIVEVRESQSDDIWKNGVEKNFCADGALRVYDGRKKLLMSGFFNCHGHSPMTIMRGYGENLALQNWLAKKIFPFEAKLRHESVYWATMLAMAESLRFGIVSTSDMYYMCDSIAQAVIESGSKMNISRSIVNFEDVDFQELASYGEMMDIHREYDGYDHGRIKVDMSLHGEYTSNPETVAALAQVAMKLNANMQVHVSETEDEHMDCKVRHGMTPVAYLEEHGLFETNTTAAHCVWIEDEDVEILARKNVNVAVNPTSNLKLASGVCNVPKLIEKGINVAIGTDGVASNNNLNFFEEMKLMAISSKMYYRKPEAVTPTEVLRAATIGGAMAQGRKQCGLIKKGYRADLIVVNLDRPNMYPVHDMKSNLVFSAAGSDIDLTMVDGKVLYEDGEYKTIDIEKVIFHVEREKDRILELLKK